MAHDDAGANCPLKMWIIAAIIGCVVLLVMLIGGRPFMAGLFSGVIVGGLSGVVLTWLFCRPEKRVRTAQPSDPVDPAELVARSAPEAAPEPAPEPEAPAAAAPAGTDAKPAAEPRPTPADDAPAAPAALSSPRDGTADDLKKIKGVGPKLEALLNENGIYHFDQIAAWTGAEVAWMDDNLKGFRGRVSRDGWVAQAATLAGGGDTEFSKRVDDGDVY